MLCGSCVGSKKVEYKCGWCVNTGSCCVNDGCPSGTWVQPSEECPDIPKIESVCLSKETQCNATKVTSVFT